MFKFTDVTASHVLEMFQDDTLYKLTYLLTYLLTFKFAIATDRMSFQRRNRIIGITTQATFT